MTDEQRAAHRIRGRKWDAAHPERWQRLTDAQRKARNARVAKWKAAHPEEHRKQSRERALKVNRRDHLKRTFGLTEEAYASMLAGQAGRCAICRTDDPGYYRNFTVDHCHTTGKVRGLLCRNCNSGIGQLKDSPELLLRAHSYLIEGK